MNVVKCPQDRFSFMNGAVISSQNTQLNKSLVYQPWPVFGVSLLENGEIYFKTFLKLISLFFRKYVIINGSYPLKVEVYDGRMGTIGHWF